MTQDEVLIAITKLNEKVDGIHQRLDKLNGSVARHEQELNTNVIDHTQILSTVGRLLGDLNDRTAAPRKSKEIWFERVLWFVSALFLAYIVKYFAL